ncbi:MAG: type I methionyl aminopeptidase [Pelagibacteraceae bacterium TMED237]|nr:MAG: type I methionyl aminopeptidase [Pelagibacteraceae bacterium TMED237]|tara:strand:+ start:907 stop:1701 length:795 start_codon:yes stop_codon:yes gene_type:complete
MRHNNIPIYSKKDFENMRQAGSLAAHVLDSLYEKILPGISTLEINDICHEIIIKNNASPAPLNYKGFPKSVCTSVNHVVCHGIPSEKKILEEGDIVNVDVTVILKGWYGDSSRMFVAGKTNKKIHNFLKFTYDALLAGINEAVPGNHIGDIGSKIQKLAENNNYSVVRDFCGHGIGREFHTPPSVLHFGERGEGPKLEPGMFITIEPMINLGGWQTKILNDGWTAVTRDKSLSAQFEHTIGITENGNEIFTLSKNDTAFPIKDI